MHIYAQSLPPWYQSDIAALFGSSARTMAGCSIPARLAEDWVTGRNEGVQKAASAGYLD